MALPQIISRNISQKITNQVLNGNENSIGTTVITILTVGTGKKIEILGIANRYVSGGGNTNMDIIIGGQRLRRASSADSNLVDIPQGKGQVLTAAQTITLEGDSGSDNGSMNFMISYRETPI